MRSQSLGAQILKCIFGDTDIPLRKEEQVLNGIFGETAFAFSDFVIFFEEIGMERGRSKCSGVHSACLLLATCLYFFKQSEVGGMLSST